MKLALLLLVGLFCLGSNGEDCLPSDLGCLYVNMPGSLTASYKWDCNGDAWQTTTYANVEDCSGTGVTTTGVTTPVDDTFTLATCGGTCANYFVAEVSMWTTAGCTGDASATMKMAQPTGCNADTDSGTSNKNVCNGATSVKSSDYSDTACTTQVNETVTITVGQCVLQGGMYMKATSMQCNAAYKIGLMGICLLGVISTLFAN